MLRGTTGSRLEGDSTIRLQAGSPQCACGTEGVAQRDLVEPAAERDVQAKDVATEGNCVEAEGQLRAAGGSGRK